MDRTTKKNIEKVVIVPSRKRTIKRVAIVLFILWVLFSSVVAVQEIIEFFNTHEFRNPVVQRQTEVVSPVPTRRAERQSFVPRVEAQVISQDRQVLYVGKVSHYSHAGCLGCSEGQIMGNGEPFNENAMTIAVPCEDIINKNVFYNTAVLVTNLDNEKSVKARITDCGGFSKYNRIADLSAGMAELLGTKTDITDVKIEVI